MTWGRRTYNSLGPNKKNYAGGGTFKWRDIVFHLSGVLCDPCFLNVVLNCWWKPTNPILFFLTKLGFVCPLQKSFKKIFSDAKPNSTVFVPSGVVCYACLFDPRVIVVLFCMGFVLVFMLCDFGYNLGIRVTGILEFGNKRCLFDKMWMRHMVDSIHLFQSWHSHAFCA